MPVFTEKKSGLSIDFSERFRFVAWDNAVTLGRSDNDGSVFTRNRTSVGLKWNLSEKLEVYFKATNEFRIYIDPEKDFNIHEVFIDNLYLKIRDALKLPVTLTIGRQNIFLGEGFVILDGNTYDGSRSAYFDALRADIDLKKAGLLTVVKLWAEKTDELLPVLNPRNQLMNEHDMRGFGIYYQGRIRASALDLYFISRISDIREDKSWRLNVDTFGGKITLRKGKKLSLTAESALQKGESEGRKISSFGGHFHIDYNLENRLFRKLTLGGVWLTGNNPGSDELNGWIPPFSRWPKWSESYIYTLIMEGGIAYWTNYSSLFFSMETRLFRNGSLNTSLHFLGAPEKNSFPSPINGDGKSRGTLLINKLNFRLSKQLTGHFLWEHFVPGDYYWQSADNYHWLRFELMYQTKTGRK